MKDYRLWKYVAESKKMLRLIDDAKPFRQGFVALEQLLTNVGDLTLHMEAMNLVHSHVCNIEKENKLIFCLGAWQSSPRG